MVNTEFKFQAKTPNSSKVHIRKESQNNFKFNLTLKVKVKVTSFQTHLRHFKISSWKVKFKTIQILEVKTKILKV